MSSPLLNNRRNRRLVATRRRVRKPAAPKRPSITNTQRGVYHVLKHFGSMTDWDLVRQYEILKDHTGRVHPSQSPSGLRTRRAELVAKGYVEDSGSKIDGRKIWQAV